MLLNAKWVITPTKLCAWVCVCVWPRPCLHWCLRVLLCAVVCVILQTVGGYVLWIHMLYWWGHMAFPYGGATLNTANASWCVFLFFLLVSLSSCRFCCSCWLNKLDLDKSWAGSLVAAIRRSSVSAFAGQAQQLQYFSRVARRIEREIYIYNIFFVLVDAPTDVSWAHEQSRHQSVKKSLPMTLSLELRENQNNS